MHVWVSVHTLLFIKISLGEAKKEKKRNTFSYKNGDALEILNTVFIPLEVFFTFYHATITKSVGFIVIFCDHLMQSSV